jgi:predicted GNAT family acetyltransferase
VAVSPSIDFHKHIAALQAANTPHGYQTTPFQENIKHKKLELLDHPKDVAGLDLKLALFQNGQHVGIVHTQFYKDPSTGKHTANIVLTAVAPHLEGSGIAKNLIKNMLTEYPKLGVERITLEAGKSVGKYAWASMGFKPSPRWVDDPGKNTTQARMNSEFAKYLSAQGLHTDANKINTTALDPLKVSEYSVNGRRVGKEFLLSDHASDWRGHIDLVRGDPNFEHARKKVGAQ